MEFDNNELRLNLFEDELKCKDIQFTHGDDNARFMFLASGGTLYDLFKEYSKEVYDICSTSSDLEQSETYEKFKIIAHSFKISDFKKVWSITWYRYIYVGDPNIGYKEMIEYVRPMVKKINSAAQAVWDTYGSKLPHAQKNMMMVFSDGVEKKKDGNYYSSISFLRLSTEFEERWDEEAIFFLIMKFNEILNEYNFKFDRY